MTPQEWNSALAPAVGWKEAYAAVGREARSHLIRQNPDEYCTTAELAEELYPVAFARGDAGVAARKRILKALQALAEHELADCCERGQQRPRKGTKDQMIRPWHWFKPEPPAIYGDSPVMLAVDLVRQWNALSPEERSRAVTGLEACPCCGQAVF